MNFKNRIYRRKFISKTRMSTINNGKKNNDEQNKCQECMGCAAISIGLLSVLAIVAAGIYHIYLSIAGLAGVSNTDIRELCNSSAINATSEYTYIGDDPSEIWMYVLMSLIFVSGGIGNTAKNATEKKEDGSSLTIPEQMCALHCSAILLEDFVDGDGIRFGILARVLSTTLETRH